MKTGALPSGKYSGNVFGVAPTVLRSWQRALGKTIAPGLHGRCLDTLLHVSVGDGEPAFETLFHVIDSWVAVISHSQQHRDMADACWPAALAERKKRCKRLRWKGITGIMSATIAVLLDLSLTKPLRRARWTGTICMLS